MPPTILDRDDGQPLLYRQRLNLVFGAQWAGKSWLALIATAQELMVGCDVVYLDYEGDEADALERLIQLGVPQQAILRHLYYFHADEPFDEMEEGLERQLTWEYERAGVWKSASPTLVVVDGVTAALSLDGLDPNVGTDVVSFHRALSGSWLSRTGAAILLVDHVGVDSDGRRPIGSERKLSGITGSAFSFDVVAPFGRDRTGTARLRLRKGSRWTHWRSGRRCCGHPQNDQRGRPDDLRTQPTVEQGRRGGRAVADHGEGLTGH